jgi:hypothetical protein
MARTDAAMPPAAPSPLPSRPWSTTRFALTVWCGVVLLVFLARAPYYFGTALEHGDGALNALQIDHAKHFSEIHGNYSRFRFNHPGPAFFYVYALAETVLCDWLPTGMPPIIAHNFAGMVLQAGFFALGLALLREFVRAPLWPPLVLLAGAVHFQFVDYALWSIWPPHVLLMPFFAFGAACLAVASGRLAHLPWVLLAGSFLAHGHVAQPLFVGPLSVVAYAVVWRRDGAPWRRARGAHLAAGVILAVALVPLGLDALRGSQSNLAEILRHLNEAQGTPKKWLKVLLYLVSYFGYVRDQDTLLRQLSWESTVMFRTHAAAFATWAALAVAGSVAWWRVRATVPEERAFWGRFAAGWGLTLMLCAVWARVQTGSMFEFNTYFFHGVTFAALFPLLRWGAGVLESWAPPRPVAVGLVLLAVAVGWFTFRRGPLNDAEAGLQRLAATRAALQASPARERAKMLVFDDDTWNGASSVALTLQRSGVPFAIRPEWRFMMPRRVVPESVLAVAPLPFEVWRVLPAAVAPHGLALGDQQVLLPTESTLAVPSTLAFGPESNGRLFLVAGLALATPEDQTAWFATSDVVLQFLPGATPGDVELVFDCAPWSGAEATLTIHFNGAELWRGSAARAQRVQVRIPAAFWREREVATLRLHLPGARNPYSLARPSAWTGPGLSLQTLEFRAAGP